MLRLLLGLLLISTACVACSCHPRPACGGYRDQARYFIGVPINRVIVGDSKRPTGQTAIYTIRITERLSITSPPLGETEVRTGTGGSDCSWHFQIGKSYFFEATPSETGQLYTTFCTWTGEVRYRELYVRSLRSIMAGRVPASLLGAVTRWDGTADESKGEESHPPLVGIPVTLRSENGRVWHSMSDSQGVVTFEALPAGSYSIIPTFPQTLTFDRGQNLGHDYAKVTIPASSPAKPAFCRASLEGIPSSGIEGRVLTSGHTLQNTVVIAWLIKNGKKREIADDFPENGNFRLPHLPAGIYRITLSEDSGKHRLPAYTQIVEVREARITRVVLARK